ncbi:hypothetical protein EV360DRAFT_70070 [Lentinula raphanica]|nr:hypothetical protein EV360DRAFT_70070 [Lentinula raphanica]
MSLKCVNGFGKLPKNRMVQVLTDKERLSLQSIKKMLQMPDARVEKQWIQNEKWQAAIQVVNNVTPILTLTSFDYLASLTHRSKEYLTIAELTKQLKWHKKNDIQGPVPITESSWEKQEVKVKLLRFAIEVYIMSKRLIPGLGDIPEEEKHMEDIPDITAKYLETFQENRYDSEEEYYRQ